MKVCFWGVRGSLATPDEGKLGYGGNTACVHVELPEAHVVLDAGTGIRRLGETLVGGDGRPIYVLLTHLHLDHIQGLLFFAPLFEPGREIVIYGPANPHARRGDLRTALARYLSAPLSPVELRELPAAVRFERCPPSPYDVGGARVTASAVLHRGLTLGFRIAYGDTTIAYVPDHEPALSGDLDRSALTWLSGAALCQDVDLLIHDGQYSPAQYAVTRGWGHSTFLDAVRFGARVGARELLLTHHDPAHDDAQLDAFGEVVAGEASARGLARASFAREGDVRGR